MNKSLFNRFMADKAAVNVKTQDEYNQFMQLLEKETDLTWWNGKKPTEIRKWVICMENTCIRCVDNCIFFEDIAYFEQNNYEIIAFSDLMKSKFTYFEHEILSHVDNYKWIARDASNTLHLFAEKPAKGANDTMWSPVWYTSHSEFPLADLFQSVKWSDEEPVYIGNYTQKRGE